MTQRNSISRRRFAQIGGAGLSSLWAVSNAFAWNEDKFAAAGEPLRTAADSKQILAAALYVRHGDREFFRSFGESKSPEDMFLIASISKPMSVAAILTLFDEKRLDVDAPVVKYIDEFRGDGRERIRVRQLLTHTCGLPDQLPMNQAMRKRHAPLSEFVREAIRTPLVFRPGSRYGYSSMGILVATEIAHRISGAPFDKFLADQFFTPMKMTRSVLGLGEHELADVVRCQVANANVESGSGDPTAKKWDWNSQYWRAFGAPWGGVHSSARDVGRFMAEFLPGGGRALKSESIRLMTTNQNRKGFTARGFGFGVGERTGGPGCSPKTFGHTGATGTLTWADPESGAICVVLTTLPGRAANPHPRTVASNLVARAVY